MMKQLKSSEPKLGKPGSGGTRSGAFQTMWRLKKWRLLCLVEAPILAPHQAMGVPLLGNSKNSKDRPIETSSGRKEISTSKCPLSPTSSWPTGVSQHTSGKGGKTRSLTHLMRSGQDQNPKGVRRKRNKLTELTTPKRFPNPDLFEPMNISWCEDGWDIET